MSTLTQLNAKAKARIAELGLVCIRDLSKGIAGKTAMFKVSKGKITIEKHVVLGDEQDFIRTCYREVRAKNLLGIETSLRAPDVYHTLTHAQKDLIEPTVFGYEYEYL
jgi:hypothetical protein